ncbi:MAG: 2Fe-2S iron-sulfur cluster binding domain-containing protein [Oscillospiraceae bacterium]|nr:2Fe-2S iron-sulfur cluster binding domain-containing protein [Oscillospiraceae bacterium]
MAALNIKIGPDPRLDMAKFANMAKVREETIQATPAKEVSGVFPINENAKALHPDFLELVIDEVIDRGCAEAKTFVLRRPDGAPLPYFRAGQYLSLKLPLDGSFVTRSYSLCNSPKEALEGRYVITVRANPGGFVADRLLAELKPGDKILSSSPQGFFYYEKLRDAKQVIGLAGGSGITPFLSLASAIRDGIEDFDLTLLFGSRTEDNILFREELDAIAAECPRFKVFHVLSEEKKDGFESGFITADMIRKYAPEGKEYSVYLCGPEAMYRFLKPEIAALNLPERLFRRKLIDVTKTPWECEGYPQEEKGKTYQITVRQGPQECVIPASADEPVLVAIERAGIKAPSRCRAGECGWCRSRLLEGTVFIPQENEMRRWADVHFGYIHPCCSFPTGDLVLEVPGEFF